MTRLSPNARALIDRALLEEEEPSLADRSRNRAGLASRIAAGGVIASTSAAAASAKVTGLAKLFALFALAGTFSVALSVDPVEPVVRTPTVAVPPAAPIEAPPRIERPLSNEPREAPMKPIERESQPEGQSEAAHPEPQAAAKPAAKATTQDTLTAETALVKKAHLALRGGDANAALALLDQHAREYPQGQLREERAAARVLALCRLGRKDEAKRAAGRMLDERSPLAERIRSACGF